MTPVDLRLRPRQRGEPPVQAGPVGASGPAVEFVLDHRPQLRQAIFTRW
jgi:hypothetical protein